MWDNGAMHGTYFQRMPESGVVERYVWQRPDLLRMLEVIGENVCVRGLEWLEDEELPVEEEKSG